MFDFIRNLFKKKKVRKFDINNRLLHITKVNTRTKSLTDDYQNLLVILNTNLRETELELNTVTPENMYYNEFITAEDKDIMNDILDLYPRVKKHIKNTDMKGLGIVSINSRIIHAYIIEIERKLIMLNKIALTNL